MQIQNMINWHNQNDPIDTNCLLNIEIKRSTEYTIDTPKLEHQG